MCTSLSGAMGGVLTVCIDRFTSPSRAWDVAAMCNGILSGLVSITAGCATTATWAAVLIGGTGALVYTSASSRDYARRLEPKAAAECR
jgi:ammonium transporter, Amt family